jgi:flagellin
MRIQNNAPALNAHRYYGINQAGVTKSIAKLSSGYRINSAADDAAGLAISEKMRAQIRGLTMASKNTQDAISLIQTAEGGMQEIDNMVQRIRELVVYASNDTQDQSSPTATAGDRQKIQDEIDQLTKEIDSMANRVEFNKKKLINGDFAGGNASDRKDYTEAAATLNDARRTLIDFIGGDKWTEQIAKARSLASKIESEVGSTVANADTATKDLEKIIGNFEDVVSKVISTNDPTQFGDLLTTGTGGQNASGVADGVLATELESVVDALSALASAWGNSTAHGTEVKDWLTASAVAAASGGVMTGTFGDVIMGTGASPNYVQIHNELGVAISDYTTKKAIVEKSTQPGLYFQVGANANQALEMSISSVDTNMLGIGDGYGNSNIDVLKTTGKQITYQLDILDNALTYVTSQRSKLGAAQNRLEYTQNSLDISAENLTNAESRIRDVDRAKEMTNFTKYNILFQASTAMLAQANALPQGVLQMLG